MRNNRIPVHLSLGQETIELIDKNFKYGEFSKWVDDKLKDEFVNKIKPSETKPAIALLLDFRGKSEENKEIYNKAQIDFRDSDPEYHHYNYKERNEKLWQKIMQIVGERTYEKRTI